MNEGALKKAMHALLEMSRTETENLTSISMEGFVWESTKKGVLYCF